MTQFKQRTQFTPEQIAQRNQRAIQQGKRLIAQSKPSENR